DYPRDRGPTCQLRITSPFGLGHCGPALVSQDRSIRAWLGAGDQAAVRLSPDDLTLAELAAVGLDRDLVPTPDQLLDDVRRHPLLDHDAKPGGDLPARRVQARLRVHPPVDRV